MIAPLHAPDRDVWIRVRMVKDFHRALSDGESSVLHAGPTADKPGEVYRVRMPAAREMAAACAIVIEDDEIEARYRDSIQRLIDAATEAAKPKEEFVAGEPHDVLDLPLADHEDVIAIDPPT